MLVPSTACYSAGAGVNRDFNKAVEWYMKAANQGHAGAQHSLGVCYDNGRGVTQDFKKAVEWYRKSADQGNADAQHDLGWSYFTGDGVSKEDRHKAVEWYTKSANQGHVRGQQRLGVCYYYGHGVTQDYSKAVDGAQWLQIKEMLKLSTSLVIATAVVMAWIKITRRLWSGIQSQPALVCTIGLV